MKANYHTHLALCGHAVGMTEDYVREAIEYGFEILGMSDHGPILTSMMTEEEYKFNWLDRQMTYDDFINVYLPDVLATKEKYKDHIKLLVGVEIEYLPQHHQYFLDLSKKLDYMNLGLHYFYSHGKIVNTFETIDYTNLDEYAKTAEEALSTGLYKCMVHPDVFMYNYSSVDGKNHFDSYCEEASKRVIEAAIKNNVYLEINCGGLYKVTEAKAIPGKFGYPCDEFWDIVSEYQQENPSLKVVIGLDAHAPKQLHPEELSVAYDFAKRHNIVLSDTIETIIEKNRK